MNDKKSSTNYLEHLKNLALVKLKVKECIDTFPKEHDDLLTTTNPINNNNFEDISEFIKNEKRNLKKSKFKFNLNDEINNDNKTIIKSKRNIPRNDLTNDKNNLGIHKKFLPKFYKLYIEELENHINELIIKNEEITSKLENYKNKEEELDYKTIECMKFNKFKKIAQVFKSDPRKENKYNMCDNPVCISNAMNVVNISKDYDKLLIENIKLKKLK